MWTLFPSVRNSFMKQLIETSSCLRSWLEQHNNCPTCRYSLILNQPSSVASSNRTNRTVNDMVNDHDFPFNNFHNRMDRGNGPMAHEGDGGIGIGAFNQHPFPFPPPTDHVYNFGNVLLYTIHNLCNRRTKVVQMASKCAVSSHFSQSNYSK